MTRRNMGGAQASHPRDWHEREALTMGAQMANRAMGGRYTVQDKIGTGGMAIVYRGLDEVLGRTVAIKTMLPQYANDESFAARFKQEAFQSPVFFIGARRMKAGSFLLPYSLINI